MPKVKIPRKSISLDMTAMCDMAFLLLTFFMLTTKFKPEEPIAVDMPSSISETILPDANILTISIGKEGRVFYGMDGQEAKREVLKNISSKYGITFTPSEEKKFILMSSFGSTVSDLKKVLSSKEAEKKQSGIPIDSTNNQLRDWILYSARADKQLKVAVKGDKETDYKVVSRVIAILQELNINKIKLITTMEAKPQ
ncbi:ExbD/TolR family protein [Sporocytophaga myxococcoides]|uniref:ExbD/TolR family protein n=1 Tax=Sporocytophaga myxococcoides TaxID=153721 RepID=UPI0004177AC6|nr:biopolymer transporter ExbD [Sporocytophaga myxococcoides]